MSGAGESGDLFGLLSDDAPVTATGHARTPGGVAVATASSDGGAAGRGGGGGDSLIDAPAPSFGSGARRHQRLARSRAGEPTSAPDGQRVPPRGGGGGDDGDDPRSPFSRMPPVTAAGEGSAADDDDEETDAPPHGRQATTTNVSICPRGCLVLPDESYSNCAKASVLIAGLCIGSRGADTDAAASGGADDGDASSAGASGRMITLSNVTLASALVFTTSLLLSLFILIGQLAAIEGAKDGRVEAGWIGAVVPLWFGTIIAMIVASVAAGKALCVASHGPAPDRVPDPDDVMATRSEAERKLASTRFAYNAIAVCAGILFLVIVSNATAAVESEHSGDHVAAAQSGRYAAWGVVVGVGLVFARYVVNAGVRYRGFWIRRRLARGDAAFLDAQV